MPVSGMWAGSERLAFWEESGGFGCQSGDKVIQGICGEVIKGHHAGVARDAGGGMAGAGRDTYRNGRSSIGNHVHSRVGVIIGSPGTVPAE